MSHQHRRVAKERGVLFAPATVTLRGSTTYRIWCWGTPRRSQSLVARAGPVGPPVNRTTRVARYACGTEAHGKGQGAFRGAKSSLVGVVAYV